MRKPLKMQLLEEIRHSAEMCLAGDNFLRHSDVIVAARGRGCPALRAESTEPATKTTGGRGTGVAPFEGVRPFLLAGLFLALLLLGLGKMTRAGDQMLFSGFVNATDQEASEGYFAIGGDVMVVVKPGSGLQRWLKTHAGQPIRVTLEPASPEN
jgi:hypothetical protein